MLDKTKPEFVVALGHHAAMPAAFRFLVESGTPFLMEKPWGTDAKTVNELADLAESKKAWAAVPMPFRYSWFAETAVAMRQTGGARDHLTRAHAVQSARGSTLPRPGQPVDAVEGGNRRWRADQPRDPRVRPVPLPHGRRAGRRLRRDEPRDAQARDRGLRPRHDAYAERRGLPQRGQLHVSGERVRSGAKNLGARRRFSAPRRPARACRSAVLAATRRSWRRPDT